MSSGKHWIVSFNLVYIHAAAVVLSLHGRGAKQNLTCNVAVVSAYGMLA